MGSRRGPDTRGFGVSRGLPCLVLLASVLLAPIGARGAPPPGTPIDNQAVAGLFDPGSGNAVSVDSNPVRATVEAAFDPASVAYFEDPSFGDPAVEADVGEPLFVEATAESCNRDPARVETETIRIDSALTGDAETFQATESGADTGRFRILPSVPTGDAATAPVVPGNGRIETQTDDTLTASILDCSSGEPAEASLRMLAPPPVVPWDLFVEKSVSRDAVEIGEFVDYALRVRNTTDARLGQVHVEDWLPAGFRYEARTARLAGTAIPDPRGDAGPALRFDLGGLEPGQVVELRYRVQVGPGADQGDGVNRAHARSETDPDLGSNVASARVEVVEGVFSDRGFIVGKVFADLDGNRRQDPGEPGIPGAQLLLEDGTYTVTDGQGKYSFYGIRPRTHALKLDPLSLPGGATPVALTNRFALDADSQFVDLKKGELRHADFAIESPTAEVLAEIEARRSALAEASELEESLERELRSEETPLPAENRKSLPATGVVARDGSGPTAPAIAPPGPLPLRSGLSNLPEPPVRDVPSVPLADLLPDADDRLAFLDLADGDVLPADQVNVRVKGVAGTRLQLVVNGEEVPEARVGQRAELPARGVQAWEYVGVRLEPGPNLLEVTQIDPFGNPRDRASIQVRAPGKLARLRLELASPQDGVIADGVTPTTVRVSVEDASGVAVTARTPVTLEASRGRWQGEDLDPVEPGLQLLVEGGRAEVALVPPAEPGEGLLRATSGILEAERSVTFLPHLRPLIAIGVIEGRLDFRRLDPADLVPAREDDGFEDVLTEIATESSNGHTRSSGRGAVYLKGKIKGESLLTLRYDSEADEEARLFRDIEPDRFYPVYGDSSLRGFDAQSTSRLYVRVDKERSHLLYGDYTTRSPNEAVDLGNYSRSLTGLRGHYETERVEVDAFASRDDSRQVVTEIPGRGISGPYELGLRDLLVNSEKVEIVTRDRDQPSLVLEARPASRFSDYEIDALSGVLLFREPIPTLDSNLNPVFIRVTYEVEEGVDDYWVTGIGTQVEPLRNLELGLRYVSDRHPVDPLELRSANLTLRLGEDTRLLGEVADSIREEGRGKAARVDLLHTGPRLDAWAYWGETDADFLNPSARLASGRIEAGLKARYRLDDRTRLRGEALLTEDEASDGKRRGGLLALEHSLTDHLQAEVGLRHVKESSTPAQIDTRTPGVTPLRTTSVLGKLTVQVPWVPELSVFGEVEQDLHQDDRRMVAAGGELQLANRTRLYLRHEFLSSLGSRYALNSEQERHATLLGIETDYFRDTNLFSEYRVRDAFAGRDAEAAIGLRNRWALAQGLTLHTAFERIETVAGDDDGEATAASLGLAYTRSPRWKGTSRLEYRISQTQRSFLNSFGLAAKIDERWTFLGRSLLQWADPRTGMADEEFLGRLQLGTAYRPPHTNRWSALARYDLRFERDASRDARLRRLAHVFSGHLAFQPVPRLHADARYALRLLGERSGGLDTDSVNQLVSGRVTYDLSHRWDVGLLAGTLFGEGGEGVRYALGAEVGYLLAQNFWVSLGYNVFGFEDDDLGFGDYSNPGVYLRFRMKFDEGAFRWLAE